SRSAGERMRISILAIALCLSLATALFAQSSTPAPTAVATPTPIDSSPVPVPEPSEKALQYHRSGNWLWVFDNLWGWVIPLLFLFTGFSARLRNVARRIGRRWFFVIGVYFALFSIITS